MLASQSLTFIFFIFFSITVTYAQGEGDAKVSFEVEQQLKFELLTSDDGLPSLNTRSILQDSQGYMWFATAAGLGRFDGHGFKVYLPDRDDPHSISHSNVNALHEDSRGVLWVGTWHGGLNRYDRDTDRFTAFKHDPNDPNSLSHDQVNTIYEDRQGVLWIGTLGGLNRFNSETGQFTRYRHAPDSAQSISHNSVWSIIEDAKGRYWIGTDDGLDRFELQTGKFDHYKFDPQDPNSLSSNQVRAVVKDLNGGLWVATHTGGLNHFNPEDGTFRRYQSDPDDPNSLGHNDINALYLESSKGLWVGTNGGGLNYFNTQDERFTRLQPASENPGGFNGRIVRYIYQDKDKALWFSTFEKGINTLDRAATKFQLYQNTKGDANSLSHNAIASIAESPDGILWIATKGGLNYFDPRSGHFGVYRHNPNDPDSILSDVIYGASVGRSGFVWALTPVGLERFDPATKRFTHYVTNPNTGKPIGSTTIVGTPIEDSQGFVWVPLGKGGVLKFDPANDRYTNYTNDPDDPNSPGLEGVTSILEDASGMLWFGSFGGGLRRFDPASEEFTIHRNDPEDPRSLIHDEVWAIHEDSNDIIWIGTGGGISKFDPAVEGFTQILVKHALRGNNASIITGIVGDDDGFIWLGSFTGGLVRFDPRTGIFQNYGESDGLQPGLQFLKMANKSRSGKIYFGGSNGINAFFPNQIKNNPAIPSIVFTGFTLFNEPVSIGVKDSPLDRTINQTETLNLSYQQSVFSIEFSALSYRAPEKNQYAYMLEGFDQDWNYADSSHRVATYTNMDPGSYIFRVKASNNDGVWNEQGKSLIINITPPWWQTTWFRVLAVFLVVGAIAAGFIAQRKSGIRHRRILETQVSERTRELQIAKEGAEAANRSKSIFLAQMSHDLRTPLHVILGYSELLDQDSSTAPNHKRQLQIINENGERLLTMINDVLDLSKIEAGKIELESEPFDLRRALENVGELIGPNASAKDLDLVLDMADDLQPHVRGDEQKLHQILVNLLGNAVKFTNSGGVVLRARTVAKTADYSPLRNVRLLIEVEDSGPGIPVEVKDSGPGIPEDLTASIFEPFKQTGSSRDKRKGTGLGLAISKTFVDLMGGAITAENMTDGGSRFTVELPFESVAADAVATSEPARVVGLAPGQPEFRVLMVDDNAENRLLVRTRLEQVGFAVREAENGKQAVAVFEDWSPHYMWMDMRMPEMDGYEAAAKIRTLPGGDEIPIIALTASAFKEQEGDILAAGLNGVLHKPYQESALFEMMAQHLDVEFVYKGSNGSTPA